MARAEELKALAKECDIETLRASGPGGQHVNKVETAVRIKHRQSGIVCLSRKFRSQHQNKTAALERLWAKLQERKKPKKRRLKTRPSRGSQERRIQEKKQRSQLKSQRQKPGRDD